MIENDEGPRKKIGDMATHGGDIRLIDNLLKFRSRGEQKIIDLLFAKLWRGDRKGLERSLRNKTVTSLKRRGVLDVERDQ